MVYLYGDQEGYLKCLFRHENHSPFGEIRRFETKIGDLRESCRSDEKIFFWGGCVRDMEVYHRMNCDHVRA